MAEVLLIRHAETRQDPNQDSRDWVLADGAQAACTQLAEELRPLHLRRLVTSAEVKARETGLLLAAVLNVPCEAAPGLEEHHRQGVPFMDPDAWQETLTRFFAEPGALVLGQETAAAARERYGRALESVLKRHRGERLGVVSHASVMALFVAGANGLDAYTLWQTLKMPDALRLSLPEFRLLEPR